MNDSRTWATWAALWLPGLAVGIGACVATAHGLYEVALGAGVPQSMAWLYPLITDGLALVAYATTARLVDGGRTYAWCVVVLAAGLSGLAQASYLGGGLGAAPMALRFGVGAWPAIAAAIVAHLLFLLGHAKRSDRTQSSTTGDVQGPVQTPVQNGVRPAVQTPVQGPKADAQAPRRTSAGQGSGSARERARKAAHKFAAQNGKWPTVTRLMELADVARGTAGNALKELRDQPAHLHVVNEATSVRTDQ